MLDVLARGACRVSVRGIDRLPGSHVEAGAAIIVANHTSAADVAVVIAVLRRAGLRIDPPCRNGCEPGHRHIQVLATEDVFGYPVVRDLLRDCGVIEVRDDHGTVALRRALQALRAGEVVMLYPEGDLDVTPDHAPRNWRPGAEMLARLNVPVHVLAHHDSRDLGGGRGVHWNALHALTGFVRVPIIRAYVGEPVTPDELQGLSRDERQELLESRLRDTWLVARSGLLPSDERP